MGPERPGDAVAINDPFDERAVALLMSQDINMSNVLVARAEMVAGYTPVHDDIYEHVVVLTGIGTWTPPAGVKKIRVVLIGSGSGGGAGMNGASGGSTSLWFVNTEDKTGFTETVGPGKGGKGGTGGAGGAGGNIVQKTLALDSSEVFSYQAPAGGKGGTTEDPEGKSGDDTVFGNLSSSEGSPSRLGYTDVLNGITFGTFGSDGVSGGDGGDGSSYPNDGNPGSAAGGYPGSNGSSSRYIESTAHGGDIQGTVVARKWYTGGTGGGGGAEGFTSDGNFYTGASAKSVPNAINYGCGGNGGHGGGGGGGARGIRLQVAYGLGSGGNLDFQSCLGGAGSAGTDGAPGCIIIYY